MIYFILPCFCHALPPESGDVCRFQQVSSKLCNWRDLLRAGYPVGHSQRQENAHPAIAPLKFRPHPSHLLPGCGGQSERSQSHLRVNGWEDVLLEPRHAFPTTGRCTNTLRIRLHIMAGNNDGELLSQMSDRAGLTTLTNLGMFSKG